MSLTRRQRQILTLMRDHADTDDGELVVEGRQAWIGLERTSPAIALKFLRLCLVRDESDVKGGVQRYTINETGREMLADEAATFAKLRPLLRTAFLSPP